MTLCGRILSGEMHYTRIPRAYWRDRLRMARAMGLNAVSTYVFWNRHEPYPGRYDFDGENDVAAYVKIAQEEDLAVVLRPGPYVCAEWDFGGLPAWLLREREPRIRTASAAFMDPVRRWFQRLGEELASLQHSRGGPIAAVQLENEYGAFGSDREYLRSLRAALIDAGFGESPLFTIDQPADLPAGQLDGVSLAVTFAPGNAQQAFESLKDVRAQAPFLVGEYWAGWFDHWGEARARVELSQQVRDLEWMLSSGASVNVYMFHGGTNFGFWNGANSGRSHPYQPTTTSYDYEAALDEAGRPTQKYVAFREAIARATNRVSPEVPASPPCIEIGEFELTSTAPLDAELVRAASRGNRIASKNPQPMEALGQNLGFILYRTRLDTPADGDLTIEAFRDYALVMLDGAVLGYVDRRAPAPLRVPSARPGATLDILVENCGRINYGPDLPFERKGIEGAVRLDERELQDWEIISLPLDDPDGLDFQEGTPGVPAFYRGTFDVRQPGDTFLDTSDLGKGVLWVNGHNAGRFWNEGPQRRLYVPGVWLRRGRNTAIVFDIYRRIGLPKLRGVSPPAH